MSKKNKFLISFLVLLTTFVLTGCNDEMGKLILSATSNAVTEDYSIDNTASTSKTSESPSSVYVPVITDSVTDENPPAPELTWINNLNIPEWAGEPYAVINNNVPFFDTDNLSSETYEVYYALDELGRCTLADAIVGPETMPTEKRGNISEVKPTGWHSDKYDFVNGESLYNRCHLIAYYLGAENANKYNLVTGTRYMNEDGMNDFENMVGDYMRETGNHVRYRVTPKWTGDNLICDGVLMEAYSIEDGGDNICFCIYAYNLQPGIIIDYLTGDNYLEVDENGKFSEPSDPEPQEGQMLGVDVIGDYVLNTKSFKFHLPECDGAVSMNEKNRKDYHGSRNALILDGYSPCGFCQP